MRDPFRQPSVPVGVNPTIRYLFEHTGSMIWPLAWILVTAVAAFIRHS